MTADAAGNLATSNYSPNDIATLDGRLGGLAAQVDTVGRYATATRREARQGVATAMAMTSAGMPSARGRTSWQVSGATFKGEYGAGFSLAHRLNVEIPLALTAGYAYGGDKSHGARAGLAGEF